MALDKLVDSTQLDSDLTSVANAIRAKSGGSGQLAFPAGFVSAVNAIPTGGGGDYVASDWLDPNKPAGLVVSNAVITNANQGSYQYLLARRTKITGLDLPNATGIPLGFCYGCSGLASINAPLVETIRDQAMRDCTSLTVAVFPALIHTYSSVFYSCSDLTTADFLGGDLAVYLFRYCGKLQTLVLRDQSVSTLNHINAFAGTRFASGAAGGTLYVPQALIASYQAATNWSTILGYANNSIQAIEGSIYETQYADGTPIE